VLGQLTGQQQADGGLDFAGRDRRALVVVRQAGRFGSDALEDVVHETVHDAHRLRGNTGVRVDLLQHLVDVDSVALLAGLPFLLLVRLGDVFLGLARLLRSLSTGFRCHFASLRRVRCQLSESRNAFDTDPIASFGFYLELR